MNINELKKLAAEKAVEEITSDMIVGLGSGSTVQFALEKISEKIKNGELKNVWCIPSSNHTEEEANRLGIPIITFSNLYHSDEVKSETEDGEKNSQVRNQKHCPNISERSEISIKNPNSIYTLRSALCIDITIDGADEVAIDNPEHSEGSNKFNLIKGGGGALLREKILAQASKKNIIIIDESKLSKYLGTKWHVPIEVIQFALSVEKEFLESIGAKIAIRKKADGSNYITDENNFILDADFGEIKNPAELAAKLNQRAGIVEHGLFIGLATKVISAANNGINIIERGLS